MLRQNGGDVIVSFGGAIGSPLLQCADQEKMYSALLEVYRYTNATYFDFDIEGEEQTETEAIKMLVGALKQLQGAMKNMRLSLTIPVLPSGLTSEGLGVYKIFVNGGVTLDSVNIMAMDFGQSAAPPGVPMSTYITQSMANTSQQIKSVALVGVTPMIGLNDDTQESTTLKDAATVATFAKENGYRSIGMWSVDRDHPCADEYVSPKCSSVCSDGQPCQVHDYDYMNIFKKFTD